MSKTTKTVALVGGGKVILVQTETAIEQEFDIEHAERILAYDVRIAKTNWELVDKTLKFDNGKIYTGSSDQSDKSTEE